MPRASRRALILLAAVASLVACASPEATRTRGAGAKTGADVGNWSEALQMHEGSKPYWETARLIEPYGMDNLDAARQAHRLSAADGSRRRR